MQKIRRMLNTWRIQNIRRMLKTWCIQNIRRMLKTWCIQNIRRMVNTRHMEKYWRLQKCWRCRKSRRTLWRTALLFRLSRICNCWLLSGLAVEHVLLLGDVLNLVHVVSKWRMVLQCPADYPPVLCRPAMVKMVKSLAQAKYLAPARQER
jgi:hypothetical protein